MMIRELLECDVYEETSDLVISYLGREQHELTDKWISDQYQDVHISAMLNEKPQHVLTDQWITDKMMKSQKLAFDEQKEEGKLIEEIIPKEFHGFIPTVFSERPIGELPTRKPYDHAIDLVPNFKAQRQHPFRMDEKQKKAVEEFIEESLAKGFIKDSKSPQTSALFFVPKTDGRLCPVQDYQYINHHTIRNAYPLPRINDLVDKMKDFDCYIKMDIWWGYNNVRIKEGDEWKAAFSCHLGSFEPLVQYFSLPHIVRLDSGGLHRTEWQAVNSESWTSF